MAQLDYDGINRTTQYYKDMKPKTRIETFIELIPYIIMFLAFPVVVILIVAAITIK